MKKIGKTLALCLICFCVGRISYAVETLKPAWYIGFIATIHHWKQTVIVETPMEARGTNQDESGQEFLKENEK